MAALARALPAPVHVALTEEEPVYTPAPAPTAVIPRYGARKSWKPKVAADYAGGGAYPECHVAQYPLDMGRKKPSGAGTTLALQVDANGVVKYDALAQQGRGDTKVYSQFKDLVPMSSRTDIDKDAQQMARPSDEEIAATQARTKAALEKITTGKIKAGQSSAIAKTGGNSQYIRYTPAGSEGKQRIIKMTEVQEDPLEPPRFKGKKIPRGPPTPPPPVLQSPPRKATAQDQKDWMIPPCISNWKNSRGFTIPLDKRLAADGRGLQDVHINDNFAKLTEALYVADRHARQEVHARSQMQQLLAEKEKAQKEENLRLLAQRAREERSGIAPPRVAPAETGVGGLAGYGSGSDSEDESASEHESEDDAAVRAREEVREERRREREKEMRMSNMGTEQRAKMLMREQNRDISEKIALGLAKPTASKETLIDSRLFNREQLSTGFAGDESYSLYDKPLFQGSTAAAAIYKRGGNTSNDEAFGGGTEDGISKELEKDRFALGVARGLGADTAEIRDGPVQFEKDVVVSLDKAAVQDPFGVESFMDAAKRGGKRNADADGSEARKRAREE